MIRVLLADDHEIVRLGLATLLSREADLEIVGEAADGEEAVAKALRLSPDVVIMDIRMPGKSGIEACREILATLPRTKVLMLTSFADEEAVMASILAGAQGYVLKQIGSQGLIDAIAKVMQGQSLIPPEMMGKVLGKLKGEKAPLETLTSQERKILALISQGKTNKEIAQEIYLSEKTVRNYVSNILHKLNLTHRSQAAVYAVKHRLDSEP